MLKTLLIAITAIISSPIANAVAATTQHQRQTLNKYADKAMKLQALEDEIMNEIQAKEKEFDARIKEKATLLAEVEKEMEKLQKKSNWDKLPRGDTQRRHEEKLEEIENGMDNLKATVKRERKVLKEIQNGSKRLKVALDKAKEKELAAELEKKETSGANKINLCYIIFIFVAVSLLFVIQL